METPSFFSKVIGEGFVKSLIDKDANSPFELNQDLDEVTRATYTSKGIAEAVRKASHHIAESQLNLEVPKTARLNLPLEDYLVLALLLAVFILQKLKLKKLRNLTFLANSFIRNITVNFNYWA